MVLKSKSTLEWNKLLFLQLTPSCHIFSLSQHLERSLIDLTILNTEVNPSLKTEHPYVEEKILKMKPIFAVKQV